MNDKNESEATLEPSEEKSFSTSSTDDDTHDIQISKIISSTQSTDEYLVEES